MPIGFRFLRQRHSLSYGIRRVMTTGTLRSTGQQKAPSTIYMIPAVDFAMEPLVTVRIVLKSCSCLEKAS